ncbi:hypothetical protein DFQ27_005313 [Actinomortierella ambigua]|uniref:Uncharacterized protein n=1 Tax=Actinomortierella ambigua TaxID=1343610 RepID=A0A9P6U2Q8_9FUNG|nr:hypothetical protein DFQ27_005313 [Actinomortierella ambigua]
MYRLSKNNDVGEDKWSRVWLEREQEGYNVEDVEQEIDGTKQQVNALKQSPKVPQVNLSRLREQATLASRAFNQRKGSESRSELSISLGAENDVQMKMKQLTEANKHGFACLQEQVPSVPE